DGVGSVTWLHTSKDDTAWGLGRQSEDPLNQLNDLVLHLGIEAPGRTNLSQGSWRLARHARPLLFLLHPLKQFEISAQSDSLLRNPFTTEDTAKTMRFSVARCTPKIQFFIRELKRLQPATTGVAQAPSSVEKGS